MHGINHNFENGTKVRKKGPEDREVAVINFDKDRRYAFEARRTLRDFSILIKADPSFGSTPAVIGSRQWDDDC
jgi:hypothetical protein